MPGHLRHIERRLPRYTSYPTAPHFGPEIGAREYRSWLGRVAPKTPVSLYLHIPFCRELCWFCGCSTRVVRSADIVARYAGRLMDEIDLVADALPGNPPAGHVHFGGGSPNALGADMLSQVIDRLDRRFRLGPAAEVAVEFDPRTTDAAFIRACAASGVTRASVGVQDLDPTVQRAINRIQPYETIVAMMERLHAAGIGDINVDLMYGLPHQTVDIVLNTVAQVAGLRPARIALFGYAHVPWMKAHQRLIDEAWLPGPEERVRQFDAVTQALTAAGYAPVGMDHFALPESPLGRASAAGTLRRNFQGYTTDNAEALLGFGASAIGMLHEGYVQNAPDVRAWEQAVENGNLPVCRGIAIDGDDRLRCAVIERLMCDMAADLDGLARRYGRPKQDWTAELASLRQLQADGLIDLDGPVIRVRPESRALVRVVAAVFDRYLEDGAAGAPKHAAAV
ncbi:MAG: oxygen-independent coproporphyrinogen III oxidase [Alphaproteobacteria bacterium]